MKFRLIFSITLLLLIAAASVAFVQWRHPQQASLLDKRTEQTIAELKKLTGARTRLVWATNVGEKGDTYGRRKTHKLMGLDTDDGKGIREVLPKIENYRKPLLTPKGDRVVYSDYREAKVHIVNWDGTGHRELVSGGFATDVWMDPATSIEWVYVARGDKDELQKVVRYQLDNPKKSEPVWTRTLFNRPEADTDNFQLSADGTYASGLFPWPECGIVNLPDGSFEKTVSGCWPSMAPDNSYVSWVFDGPHRNVMMHAFADGKKKDWQVNINNAPGIRGYEVYHPRWSNDVHFMTMTGPYTVGEGEIKIKKGGPAVEVYLGKFSDDLRNVVDWVRVTHNEATEIFPDAWIEGGEKSMLAGFAQGQSPSTIADQEKAPWPIRRDEIVFLWENDSRPNEITRDGRKVTCKVEPRDLAKYGRFHDMDVRGGAFIAPDSGEAVLSAVKKSGAFAIEALVTAQNGANGSIISLSDNKGNASFRLAQERDELFVQLHDGEKIALGAIPVGESVHVIVSCKSDKLSWHLDGEAGEASVSIDPDKWKSQHLVFGDDWSGGHDWAGRLEKIAIYNRPVAPKEAGRKYAAVSSEIESRTQLPRLVVRPKLIKAAEIPSPQAIAPYRRALVINEYEVEDVVEGDYDRKRILVAEWGVMDGKRLSVNFAQPGRHLAVEAFDAHPELKSERIDMDRLLTAAEDEATADLELFYAIGD